MRNLKVVSWVSTSWARASVPQAMRDDLHFALAPGRNAKQQALEVMKRLPAVMPIARARMMVRVHPAGGSAERPGAEGLVAALRAAGAQPRAAAGAGAAAASEGSGVEAPAGDEGASGGGLDFLIEPDTFQKVTRAPGLRGGVPCEEVTTSRLGSQAAAPIVAQLLEGLGSGRRGRRISRGCSDGGDGGLLEGRR